MNGGGRDKDLHFIPNYIANWNVGLSLKVVSKNHGVPLFTLRPLHWIFVN